MTSTKRLSDAITRIETRAKLILGPVKGTGDSDHEVKTFPWACDKRAYEIGSDTSRSGNRYFTTIVVKVTTGSDVLELKTGDGFASMKLNGKTLVSNDTPMPDGSVVDRIVRMLEVFATELDMYQPPLPNGKESSPTPAELDALERLGGS